MLEELCILPITGIAAALAYLDAQIVTLKTERRIKSYASGIKYYWHLASIVDLKDLKREPEELGKKYSAIENCLSEYPPQINYHRLPEESLSELIRRTIN